MIKVSGFTKPSGKLLKPILGSKNSLGEQKPGFYDLKDIQHSQGDSRQEATHPNQVSTAGNSANKISQHYLNQSLPKITGGHIQVSSNQNKREFNSREMLYLEKKLL